MGYSIAIRPRSADLARKMQTFMDEHYRAWPYVVGKKNKAQYASNPTSELDYDNTAGALGFNYGAMHGWEDEFAYTVTRWMAIKIGKKRRSFQGIPKTDIPNPIPYMVYDGHEAWPIFIVESLWEFRAVPRERRWCSYDALGMRRDYAHAIPRLVFDLPGVDVAKVLDDTYQKVGTYSGDPSNSKDHQDWVDRRHQFMAKLVRTELNKGIKVLRREMKRLDRLWEASS